MAQAQYIVLKSKWLPNPIYSGDHCLNIYWLCHSIKQMVNHNSQLVNFTHFLGFK